MFAVKLSTEYQCNNYDIKLEKNFSVTNFTRLKFEFFSSGDCEDVCLKGCVALYSCKTSHPPC